MRAKQAVFILAFCFLTSCGFIERRPFTDAVNEGKIIIGMSTREVRNAIGSPDKVAKRVIKEDDVREVWSYYEYIPNRVYVCAQSFCIYPIFIRDSGYEYPQNLIFKNDKIIGWNMADPFKPDSIIENRER